MRFFLKTNVLNAKNLVYTSCDVLFLSIYNYPHLSINYSVDVLNTVLFDSSTLYLTFSEALKNRIVLKSTVEGGSTRSAIIMHCNSGLHLTRE